MAGDLFQLESIIDHLPNNWGSNLGRIRFQYMKRTSFYPAYIFFGFTQFNKKWHNIPLFLIDYRVSDLFVDLLTLTDEPDDYWVWHTENNGNSEINDPKFGKWNFMTKYFSLGGNVGFANRGWQLIIRGGAEESFARIWINQDDPDTDPPPFAETAAHQG